MSEIESNPLKKVWNIFSSIGGAIGLVSFVDDFYQWGDFFQELIFYYRRVIHWPIRLTPIPSWILDYLFIGSMYAIAASKGYHELDEIEHENKIGKRVKVIIQYTVLFPFLLFLNLSDLISTKSTLHGESRKTLIWLGTISLIFLSFLMLNIIVGRL